MVSMVRFLAGLLVFVCLQLQAADLTNTQVGQWLASYNAVQQWTQQHQDELLALDAQEFLGGDQGGAQVTNSPLYKSMVAVLAQHGFESPNQWTQTGEQIMLAYGAVKQATVKEDFSQEIADIKNDPNMTAEQKEAMLSLLETTQQLTKQFAEVSEADKLAVASYVEQITALVGP